MTNKKGGDNDTYIDIPKTDGMLPISCLLERPPVLDKKVKVSNNNKAQYLQRVNILENFYDVLQLQVTVMLQTQQLFFKEINTNSKSDI